MNQVSDQRKNWISRLYPRGLPRLWCPLIVHYDQSGNIDRDRIRQHLVQIRPSVHAFLLFGSTGDGWALSLAAKEELFQVYTELAEELELELLIGVLKEKTSEVEVEICRWLELMTLKTGQQDPVSAMLACRVKGFTICPPHGADLSQDQISDELKSLLRQKVPFALYQLPQVTENEISPQTLSRLAKEFPHFYLFKDTSGQDKVILAGLDYAGVRFVRGMEGDYSFWYGPGRTSYDGFLLSSANCFAPELQQIIQLTDQGQSEPAEQLSRRVAAMMEAVFADVAKITSGNAFTNANKCIDHIFAFGEKWQEQPAPVLQSGIRLPVQHLDYACRQLTAQGWTVADGYLAKQKE